MRNLIKQILKEGDLEWAENAISGNNLPFEIGEPVVKPTIKDVFRINVSFMHGDADHYSDETFDFPTSDLDTFLKFLKLYQNLKGGYWGDDTVQELIQTLGIANNGDDIWEVMLDYVPRDVTGGDDYYPAHVRNISVTYFDSSGVEREVKLNPPDTLYKTKDFGSRF